jgi:hypothetical protein
MAAYSHYDSRDLQLFRDVLDRMLEERPDEAAGPEERRLRKVRCAAAIFCCAEHGERDPERLKDLATKLLERWPPTYMAVDVQAGAWAN